jgi:hypothetical protein
MKEFAPVHEFDVYAGLRCMHRGHDQEEAILCGLALKAHHPLVEVFETKRDGSARRIARWQRPGEYVDA